MATQLIINECRFGPGHRFTFISKWMYFCSSLLQKKLTLNDNEAANGKKPYVKLTNTHRHRHGHNQTKSVQTYKWKLNEECDLIGSEKVQQRHELQYDSQIHHQNREREKKIREKSRATTIKVGKLVYRTQTHINTTTPNHPSISSCLIYWFDSVQMFPTTFALHSSHAGWKVMAHFFSSHFISLRAKVCVCCTFACPN